MKAPLNQLMESWGLPEALSARTLERVESLWRDQLLSGYSTDPEEILKKGFPSTAEGIITARALPFHCLCPHHLTPAFGLVHLAYEPQGRIVGFGSLQHLLNALSRRLILQEQLTQELVEALEQHLGVRGAICSIEATHLCLILRGQGTQHSRIITRASLGSLKGRWALLEAQ